MIDNVDVSTPFIVEQFNRLLALGVDLFTYKSAYIVLVLMKADFESADVKSHHTKFKSVSTFVAVAKTCRKTTTQLLDFVEPAAYRPRSAD